LVEAHRGTGIPTIAIRRAGSIAYFGTYGVNDADRVISLRLEASTFLNQLAAIRMERSSLSRLTNFITK